MGKYGKYLLLLAIGFGGYMIYSSYKKKHPAEDKNPTLADTKSPQEAINFMLTNGYTDKEIREYLTYKFPTFTLPFFFQIK